MNIRTSTNSSINSSNNSCKQGAHRRTRFAFVGLVAALGLSTTACQLGSTSERAISVDAPASAPASAPAGQPGAAAVTETGDTGTAAPVGSGDPIDATDVAPEGPAGVGERQHVATDGNQSVVPSDDDPADAPIPAVDPPASVAPVVVVVTQQPQPQSQPTSPTVPPTAPPTTTPPTTPPTAPPTTTPPTTTPPTVPPTTTPPTTTPPTTTPPTTTPVDPTTTAPAAPTNYLVTVGQLKVKAGNCVKDAGDTSTFIEGWGGATGAPQYHLQTYVSTSSATEIGEPAYTITTALPGSRAVWGSVTWSFPFATQSTTTYFNVMNLGTTTIRDHRSLTMLDGVSTCSPEISYSITVAEQP